MITLALDTSGPWCTVAIVSPDKILANPSENIGKGHAERLAPMVQTALDQANIKATKIDRIAVCTGPGSFTGLRVALAYGRSFALPRKTPVIGISALHAMAAMADPERNRSVVSAINAKRGDVCWAYYRNGHQIHAPQTMPVDEAKDVINRIASDEVVGDANAMLGYSISDIDHVNGPVFAWLANDLKPDENIPAPFYARGPDAKLPGGKTP